LRASVRGIDLILEEGMNVKVCTFLMEKIHGFAKKTSHDDLVVYLEDNAKDFIGKHPFDETAFLPFG
jgi:DNA primase